MAQGAHAPAGDHALRPESADEDLAQRVTEETGAAGDPYAHNERKAGEIATEMTGET